MYLSRILKSDIPSPVAEGNRTRASFVLKKWRRWVSAGLIVHHPWINVGDNSLRYIPKYEGGCRIPSKISLMFLRVVGFIAENWTPKAAVDAITHGLCDTMEGIGERSDLPPLPSP